MVVEVVVGIVLPWCITVVVVAAFVVDVTEMGGGRKIVVVVSGTVPGVVTVVVVSGTVPGVVTVVVVSATVVDVEARVVLVVAGTVEVVV